MNIIICGIEREANFFGDADRTNFVGRRGRIIPEIETGAMLWQQLIRDWINSETNIGKIVSIKADLKRKLAKLRNRTNVLFS